MELGIKITPTRQGTALVDQGEFYLKASDNVQKIEAEFNYFQNLPVQLRSFHPEVKRSNPGQAGTYLIKKILCQDAAIVFAGSGQFPAEYLQILLKQIDRFLDLCPKQNLSSHEFQALIRKETVDRNLERCQKIKALPQQAELSQLVKNKGFSDLPTLAKKLNELALSFSEKVADPISIYSHGDLCFSNLLLINQQLFLIDPRGQSSKEDVFRSPYYDFAKLSQCLLGFYDFINYSMEDPSIEFKKSARQLFESFLIKRGIHLKLTRAIEASHFFSMIPLHADNPRKTQRFLQRSMEILNELS